MSEIGDRLTEGGAARLVAIIRAYWLKRKFAPSVWVEKMATPGDSKQSSVFVVRSDMVYGLPLASSKVRSVA